MGGRAMLYRGQTARPWAARGGATNRLQHASRCRTSAQAIAEPPAAECVEKAHSDQIIRNGDTESSYVQLQVRIVIRLLQYIRTPQAEL